ncbi:MAG TPA: cytochrome c [Longimicrobiales bacterium]|nr:cytochrome c [Longimicrobiales bacterium]
MRTAIRLNYCLVVAAAWFGAAAPALAQAPRSVADGAYSPVQAMRGDSLFRNVCGSCHSTSEFTTADFRGLWAGKSVFTLFDQLRATMPQDNPGGLSRELYAAVIAYILQLNTYPASEIDLPHGDDELKNIFFPQAAAPNSRR